MPHGSALADDVRIDVPLVQRLIATQFPQWSHLPVTPVAKSGWDNRTFHLGAEMSVRLPSAARYAAQVEKEQHWLPRLAAHLPLPIPTPLAQGRPDEEYPWPWSIYRWLDGEPASAATIGDGVRFAVDVAKFLVALQQIDASDGPPAGAHNFFRGGPLAVYDDETRHALDALAGTIDTEAAMDVWQMALASTWQQRPVWVHGDVAAGNLLVEEERLSAVIDFGCAGVGDPACDLVIAWTLFAGKSRQAFRAALPLDAAAWARGRGWALWKALITLAGLSDAGSPQAATQRRLIADLLADAAHATTVG